jgi:hypothetical protein
MSGPVRHGALDADAPFVMETFCTGVYGIVFGYHANAAGRVEPVLSSPRNDAAEA